MINNELDKLKAKFILSLKGADGNFYDHGVFSVKMKELIFLQRKREYQFTKDCTGSFTGRSS